MAKWLAFGVMFTVAMSGLALAQQRTPNPGKSSINRVWPRVGVWETFLTRRRDTTRLECLVITGVVTNSRDYYGWGWTNVNGGLALFIMDTSPDAVSGDSISLFIDDVKVMQAKITARRQDPGQFTVLAAIPNEKVDDIKDLIRSGASIKFISDNATYSASLQGAAEVMGYFSECISHAERLNALQGETAAPSSTAALAPLDLGPNFLRPSGNQSRTTNPTLRSSSGPGGPRVSPSFPTPSSPQQPATRGVRFHVTACGSILDTATHLEWYVGPDANTTRSDAERWVKELRACDNSWTLPSIDQLKTLFDRNAVAGTGYFTRGRYWPAHISPVFSGIGRGSWVWAKGTYRHDQAPAINFNQGVKVDIPRTDFYGTVRVFAVRPAE